MSSRQFGSNQGILLSQPLVSQPVGKAEFLEFYEGFQTLAGVWEDSYAVQLPRRASGTSSEIVLFLAGDQPLNFLGNALAYFLPLLVVAGLLSWILWAVLRRCSYPQYVLVGWVVGTMIVQLIFSELIVPALQSEVP